MNRRTSVYTISVYGTADPGRTADEMAERCPIGMLTASGTDAGRAYIRVRVPNDDVALTAARTAAGEHDFVLQTGVGVHRRDVELVTR